MPRVLAALLCAGAPVLVSVALAAPPAAKAPAPGPELARLTYVEQKVEQGMSAPWGEAREGTPLRIGERLSTGAGAMLRAEFPWMAMTLSPSSAVAFPDDYFLQAVLDEGRVALEAEGREILKVVTGEAEVRGQGRVIIRRQAKTTLVTALSGRFFVEGARRTVILLSGTGTVVRAGEPPLPPVALPEPPGGISPGKDPVYVAPGQPVSLRWAAARAAYQLEVLPVGSDTVLIQRDVGAPPSDLAIPWSGAFRWRVASRDERGLEGRPSSDGLICVDK